MRIAGLIVFIIAAWLVIVLGGIHYGNVKYQQGLEACKASTTSTAEYGVSPRIIERITLWRPTCITSRTSRPQVYRSISCSTDTQWYKRRWSTERSVVHMKWMDKRRWSERTDR